MDEKSLYSHILNLSEPWQVKSLSLDEAAGSVTVIVCISDSDRLACPCCGKQCPVHDHRHRSWRHLDTCQFTTLVKADVPRIKHPDHGCQTLPVPWAGAGSRYTLLCETFVISWLKVSTVDAVRKQLRLSWNAVDDIMKRAVRRGLACCHGIRSEADLCVDEAAFKKGHQYITIISDIQGKALAITDDRGVESLAGYLQILSSEQKSDIRTLSMDMNPAYISAARTHLPDAMKKIAVDHFHVAKMLCAVVDKSRQWEIKRIPLQDRKSAHRLRYLWLYGKQKRYGGPAEKLKVAQQVLPERLTDKLMSLGYAPASQKNHVSGILAKLMIVNRDPGWRRLRLNSYGASREGQTRGYPVTSAAFHTHLPHWALSAPR